MISVLALGLIGSAARAGLSGPELVHKGHWRVGRDGAQLADGHGFVIRHIDAHPLDGHRGTLEPGTYAFAGTEGKHLLLFSNNLGGDERTSLELVDDGGTVAWRFTRVGMQRGLRTSSSGRVTMFIQVNRFPAPEEYTDLPPDSYRETVLIVDQHGKVLLRLPDLRMVLSLQMTPDGIHAVVRDVAAGYYFLDTASGTVAHHQRLDGSPVLLDSGEIELRRGNQVVRKMRTP